MSLDQIKAFFQKVNEDEALAQKLKDAQAAFKGDKSDKDAFIAAVFIPVAAKAGFNFTVEDFKEVFDDNEEGESSANELKAVAGGGGCNDELMKAQSYCGNNMTRQKLCGSISVGISCQWGIQT